MFIPPSNKRQDILYIYVTEQNCPLYGSKNLGRPMYFYEDIKWIIRYTVGGCGFGYSGS
jgi:hypothetical protein